MPISSSKRDANGSGIAPWPGDCAIFEHRFWLHGVASAQGHAPNAARAPPQSSPCRRHGGNVSPVSGRAPPTHHLERRAVRPRANRAGRRRLPSRRCWYCRGYARNWPLPHGRVRVPPKRPLPRCRSPCPAMRGPGKLNANQKDNIGRSAWVAFLVGRSSSFQEARRRL